MVTVVNRFRILSRPAGLFVLGGAIVVAAIGIWELAFHNGQTGPSQHELAQSAPPSTSQKPPAASGSVDAATLGGSAERTDIVEHVQSSLQRLASINPGEYLDFERVAVDLDVALGRDTSALTLVMDAMNADGMPREGKLFLAGLVGLYAIPMQRLAGLRALDETNDETLLYAGVTMLSLIRPPPQNDEERALFWQAWFYGIADGPSEEGSPLLESFRRHFLPDGNTPSPPWRWHGTFQDLTTRSKIADAELQEYICTNVKDWPSAVQAATFRRLAAAPALVEKAAALASTPNVKSPVREASFAYIVCNDLTRAAAVLDSELRPSAVKDFVSAVRNDDRPEIDLILSVRYQGEPRAGVRSEIVSALLMRRSPGSWGYLASMVSQERDADILDQVARGIGQQAQGNQDLQAAGVPALRELLRKSDPKIREAAVRAASTFVLGEARTLVASVANNDPDEKIRRYASRQIQKWASSNPR